MTATSELASRHRDLFDRMPHSPTADRFSLYIGTGDPLPVINEVLGKHWSTYGRISTDWQAATTGVLRHMKQQSRRFEAARFWFFPLYPESFPGELCDTAATLPATKAIVDALVAARVLPDDNAWHNRGESHEPAERRAGLLYPLIELHVQRLSIPDEHIASCSCRAKYEAKISATATRKARK